MAVMMQEAESPIGGKGTSWSSGIYRSGQGGHRFSLRFYMLAVLTWSLCRVARPSDARRMALAAGLDGSTATDRVATVASASIVFLTVPDDAIGSLCAEIAREGGWLVEGQGVVHCSGALPSDVLQPARDGGAMIASFHPLQSFASLDAALEHLPGSTFALEGDPPLVAQLDELVALFGGEALHLRAEQKTLYHAAASIASNYMVTLASISADLLVREGIAPDKDTPCVICCL